MKKIPLPGRFLPVLLLCAGALTARAQTRTLSGTVTTEGRPLAGVSVSQEGRSTTAVTNSQGYWQLTTEGDHPVLLFRHPDYAEERTEAGTQTTLNTQLTRRVRVSEIEEVVVNAGYYKVKDRERTGSIARVTARDIENQPVTNVLSAVQGRMAGVSITQSSGVPGGGFDVQIRGRNSLRTLANSTIDGNAPLYIIDGIPMTEMISQHSASIFPARSINPLSTLAPETIASIEILKDADATSIYGSRGANGVILITTKKAQKGKLGLTFNSSFGVSSALNRLKMLSTTQYLEMRRQAYINDGITTYPVAAYDLTTWDAAKDTDWRKTLIGNQASSMNQQLTLSAGTGTTSWLLSLGRQEQHTVFGHDFKYTQYSVSSQLNHQSQDRRFNFSMSNGITFQKNNLLRTDVTRQSYILPPNAPSLYQPDGSLNWENNTFANPLAAYNSTYTNDNRQFRTSLNLRYNFLRNFHTSINGGINYQTLEEWMLQPHTIYNPASAAGQSSAYSRSSFSNHQKVGLIVEPQLGWDYVSEDHQLNLIAGSTIHQDISTTGSLSGVGFESNAFINNIAAAKTKTIGDHLTTDYRYLAFFGRAGYQYRNKYFLNLTGRRDGSSRFGPENRFASFGAIGASWIFSEEQFLNQFSWLSFGKLRGSFGTAGSDNIGDHQYYNTYTVSPLIYNGITGLIPSRLYNPDYSWEKTKKLEAAIELGFFNNRINVSLAWYKNRSSQQLIGYQLPVTTGFTSILANLNAEVENRGWEIELQARPVSSKNFRWETGFNITFPVNRLISFPGLEQSTYANTFVLGHSTSVVHLYHLEGIDPATGLYRFTDVNGDGKISAPDDTKTLSDLSPQYFGGWHNNLKFKQWDLSFLWQFIGQQNRNYHSIMPVPGSMNNQPEEVLNVWTPENPSGVYMPYTSGSNGSKNALHGYFQNSDASVSDASFIRLKNLSLGYSFVPKDAWIREVKLYLQGQNLLTFSRYFGVDPEFTQQGYLPPLRTYSLGFQLQF